MDNLGFDDEHRRLYESYLEALKKATAARWKQYQANSFAGRGLGRRSGAYGQQYGRMLGQQGEQESQAYQGLMQNQIAQKQRLALPAQQNQFTREFAEWQNNVRQQEMQSREQPWYMNPALWSTVGGVVGSAIAPGGGTVGGKGMAALIRAYIQSLLEKNMDYGNMYDYNSGPYG